MAGEGRDDAPRSLTEEVAALRDLFERRLLEDRDKRALLAQLQDELAFARSGLVDQYLMPLYRELLLIVDRLESTEETPDLCSTVREELVEVLARRGVRAMEAAPTFDPSQHEAAVTVPEVDELTVGAVTRVLREGYLLEDRILRPAQVEVVAAEPEAVQVQASREASEPSASGEPK